jgi:hypothetical protein
MAGLRLKLCGVFTSFWGQVPLSLSLPIPKRKRERMGCDGGSIPKREEMVKTKKPTYKTDISAAIKAIYSTCALSKEPLVAPVVSCALGKLYNKQSILKYLIDKTSFGDADKIVSHVTSLKDVVVLNLTVNPLAGKEVASAIQSAFQERTEASLFICPVTLKEMNGNSKFSYLATCGCVLSELALKEVDTTHCLICNKEYNKNEDVVLINPISEVDVQTAKDRLFFHAELKRMAKENKKSKKRKTTTQEPAALLGASSDEEKNKKPKNDKINMELPDLSSLDNPKTKVVQSLYHAPGEGENKGNYLSKGTFNRYAL